MSKSLFTTIIEEIAPTTETVGVVGQLYLDTVEKKLYQCVSVTTETVDEVEVTTYQWSSIGGVSQEDFDKLVNNTKQIKNSANPNRLLMGGAILNTSVATGIGIGNGAKIHANTISIGHNADSINSGSISIGNKSYSYSGGTSIGDGAESSTDGVSIGNGAKNGTDPESGYKSSKNIQLGNGTNIHSNTFQIFNDNIYNHSTHTATLQNIEQNGNPVYATLKGEIDPTSETVGSITQLYLNTATKTLFQCVNITSEVVEEVETFTYEWKEIGSGSGAGNVDLTNYYNKSEVDSLISSIEPGSTFDGDYNSLTNTPDLSIYATNEALNNKAEQTSLDAVINNEAQIVHINNSFKAGGALSATEKSVCIGYNSRVGGGGGSESVAIGPNAESPNHYSVAIGRNAKANSTNAIAIGHQANANYYNIQIGAGTNTAEKTLQIYADNIYDAINHTLTVQNISLNGTDINTVITNALPTLTSQLTNDSGYLTAADLTESTVTTGGTTVTIEEVAAKAANSIQIDDAATTSDIDSLFETPVQEDIVQEANNLDITSTDAEITQDGTNLDIGE